MLNKRPEQVTEVDLQALVTAGYSERRSLDYKRDFPETKDGGRAEFAADVSSSPTQEADI